MSIEEAIEILKEEYKKANELPFVWSPIAYAMHEAWKRVDREERKNDHRRI